MPVRALHDIADRILAVKQRFPSNNFAILHVDPGQFQPGRAIHAAREEIPLPAGINIAGQHDESGRRDGGHPIGHGLGHAFGFGFVGDDGAVLCIVGVVVVVVVVVVAVVDVDC